MDDASQMSALDTLLARLLTLHPKEIDLSLERLGGLLAALDHPERRVPPVIHVAGTNGKGSTVAFMRTMLEAAGKRVHVYTSPHLVHFRERIRLAGQLVAEDELTRTLEEVERINAGAPITFFEIITAAAFVLFARHPADVLLLETGLGGKFDATNVVEKPIATVITPVSIDHTRFLGDTIEEIAAEKAGIFKRGAPAILAEQSNAARDVLENAAARARAPLSICGQDWQVREERGRLVFEDENGLLDLPLPRLKGRHQQGNAGTAIAALRALPQLNVTPDAIEKGLTSAEWPARMQRLSRGALAERLAPDMELWLDGGHNPAGAYALAAAMGELEERHPRPLVLIVGMLDTKDSEGFLEAFSDLAIHVHAVPIENNIHSRSPEDVAAAARHAAITATAYDNFEQAFDAVVRASYEAAPRVLIAGSLYLAGEVLKLNGTPPV